MAIGNSLGDLYNNSSLASIGFGVMACTGTISGQLFNLLIGFGLNLVRQTLNSKTGVTDFPNKRQWSSTFSPHTLQTEHRPHSR